MFFLGEMMSFKADKPLLPPQWEVSQLQGTRSNRTAHMIANSYVGRRPRVQLKLTQSVLRVEPLKLQPFGGYTCCI